LKKSIVVFSKVVIGIDITTSNLHMQKMKGYILANALKFDAIWCSFWIKEKNCLVCHDFPPTKPWSSKV
jgi:hypothetical protein